MDTFHIHIKGLVQGVGFRPFVYRLAKEMNLKGWVNNTSDGVHIVVSGDKPLLEKFYSYVAKEAPVNAHITWQEADLVSPQHFDDFHIRYSETREPDLMITPDFGLCSECRSELHDATDRRFRYPFITCTNCGPRYSIIQRLPYDRENTTMAPYEHCWQCREEFHDQKDRRYYSQTNSCPACGIPMILRDEDGVAIQTDYEAILTHVQLELEKGGIIAVKGIGGYLLMCDATNRKAIVRLRDRKHRPTKPLALLYPDIATVEKDVVLRSVERESLCDVRSPIVLCDLKKQPGNGVCVDVIAPGLNRLGIMLPYAPLLELIAFDFGKPLVATSGNISGSPVMYRDEEALEVLDGVADYFLCFNREIVIPQDDSVIQFTRQHQQKIILRRSRGLAPNFFSSPFPHDNISSLAMGAELKSSFALLQRDNCYVSQFLGDQESYESQQAYMHTLRHLTGLVHFTPERIIVDSHPDYHVSQKGREFGKQYAIPVLDVQHHRAHFSAVLAENNLMESHEPVLGVIWDGTGYGDDGQIWGGEFFVMHDHEITRVAHLSYFSLLAGDKMAGEPRLSALSLAHDNHLVQRRLKEKFSTHEWNIYMQMLQDPAILTSSMGRLLDAVASLLGVTDVSTYEGEAAMRLEALAAKVSVRSRVPYVMTSDNGVIHCSELIDRVCSDLQEGVSPNVIAYQVHLSLARLVAQVAAESGTRKIAFSGGVFQNALLVDLLKSELTDHELFFHQQLSPNDECISFGQLACVQLQDAVFGQKREEFETLI